MYPEDSCCLKIYPRKTEASNQEFKFATQHPLKTQFIITFPLKTQVFLPVRRTNSTERSGNKLSLKLLIINWITLVLSTRIQYLLSNLLNERSSIFNIKPFGSRTKA